THAPGLEIERNPIDWNRPNSKPLLKPRPAIGVDARWGLAERHGGRSLQNRCLGDNHAYQRFHSAVVAPTKVRPRPTMPLSVPLVTSTFHCSASCRCLC